MTACLRPAAETVPPRGAIPPDTNGYGDPAASRAFVLESIGTFNIELRPSRDIQSSKAHIGVQLPCRQHDPELWFAEAPSALETAKALCAACPIRLACLAVAIHRSENAGVWGGHIFDEGRIVAHKRPRGRPRKRSRDHLATAAATAGTGENSMIEDLRMSGLDPYGGGSAVARLYDAERALHAAHHSEVGAWIEAAIKRLHDAVAEYLSVAVDHSHRSTMP